MSQHNQNAFCPWVKTYTDFHVLHKLNDKDYRVKFDRRQDNLVKNYPSKMKNAIFSRGVEAETEEQKKFLFDSFVSGIDFNKIYFETKREIFTSPQ